MATKRNTGRLSEAFWWLRESQHAAIRTDVHGGAKQVLFSPTQAQRSPRAVQGPGLSSSENKRPLMAQTEVCPSRLEEQRTPPLASVREDVPSSDPSVSHIRPEFHLKGSLSEQLWIRLSFSCSCKNYKLARKARKLASLSFILCICPCLERRIGPQTGALARQPGPSVMDAR